DRHETRGGMRWTRSLRETNAGGADGEVVWSWRRDAGVKLLRSKLLGGDGDNKPAHRGEHEVSRNPLRRESRIASAEPVCSCAPFLCSLAHETAGAACIRLPCALLLLRVKIDATLGRIAPRQCGRTPSCCLTIEPETHAHVVPP